MTLDRSHILSQLAAGDITAEQAAEYLRAGGAGGPGNPIPPQPPQPPQAPAAPARPHDPAALANRWLRIRVTDMATGRQRVSVNLPLAWVAAGLRIGSRYTDVISGIDIDEILSMLREGAGGRLVDVEDNEDGERVEIFVE